MRCGNVLQRMIRLCSWNRLRQLIRLKSDDFRTNPVIDFGEPICSGLISLRANTVAAWAASPKPPVLENDAHELWRHAMRCELVIARDVLDIPEFVLRCYSDTGSNGCHSSCCWAHT